MRASDFVYHLPEARIAQTPLAERHASRLLVLGATLEDSHVARLAEYLRPNDLLVFNDTRVLPARLYAKKPTGGRVELLLERMCGVDSGLFQARAGKSLRIGQRLLVEDVEAQVAAREPPFVRLRFAAPLLDVLGRYGEVPLPPYIARPPAPGDEERYQTVYARRGGAVAAPTAGLHFSESLLEGLRARGVGCEFLTLHVGAGTFKPVRTDDLSHHRMHPEWCSVPEPLCARVNATRAAGGRIVAIGTTVVRALESAWADGGLRPFEGDTRLFITPGYAFRSLDALLTNFHLPGSTLLMLVCAFGGYRRVMDAYAHAVEAGYRFYSYGDAMLVTPGADAL